VTYGRKPQTWDDKLGLSGELSENLGEPEQVPAEQFTEQTYNVQEVEELAKNSLDFLAALAMPGVFKYLYPPLFKAAWDWLLSFIHRERDFSQLALGLPRGFSKTTFVKIFCLYVILFTKRQFILICANSVPKAVAIVADVMDFLDEPNIRKVFGNWKLGVETDQQVLKKFGFRGRNITIMAGTVESVRGMNVKHQRPDVILFDDIQSRKDADSEVISRDIETDLYGTAMKAKSPHGCLFIFVGNMYPTKFSILKKLKKNPTWLKFIVGGILATGESLWEELQPIKQLLKEYENDLATGRPEIFFAEVLNDETASVNHLVDLSKLPSYPFDEDEIHQGNFIVIDPATDKVNADAVSITYFEIHDTIPVCKHIIEGRLSPGDTILEALKIALSRNCRVIGIESNSYQYTLKYWFEFICAQRGIIGIEAVELYSGTYSKNARILNMFKQLIAGEIIVHPSQSAAVNLQITQFNPLKRDNTDGLLDCLTYAPKMIELYGHLLWGSTIIEEQEFGKIRVRDVLESSAF
jgi:hypothetical protein